MDVVEWKKVKRLCHTKQLLTVNGQFSGPAITIDEGDNVEVKVMNKISGNTIIHWHGIRQYRTGWADGPAYSYTYKFSVINQTGTLLWHAHYGWQRVSVYGAFIIKPGNPYHFSAPTQAEIPIII
ncbi:Multicopper oxidase, N-terminal, partial [Dillenia turbinata]